jgi:hypothetical protein
MYKPIVKVYPLSNLAGVVVSLTDEDFIDGIPSAWIYVSYAYATKLIEDAKKGDK